MTVADRVKTLREELGLSQEMLANRMGLKDKSSVAKMEKSGDKITLKNVEKLSQALNCSIPYLMGWEEKRHTNVESAHDDELTDREKHFIECYSKLSEEQKKLVDGLMSSWLSKQESDPVSQD